MTTGPDTTRLEAAELLRDCVRWRLDPARWTGVDGILDDVDVAIRDDDHAGLTAAVRALAMTSVYRVPRPNKADTRESVSPERTERITALVRALSGQPRDDAGKSPG